MGGAGAGSGFGWCSGTQIDAGPGHGLQPPLPSSSQTAGHAALSIMQPAALVHCAMLRVSQLGNGRGAQRS